MDITDKLKQLAGTRKTKEAAQKSLEKMKELLEDTDEWKSYKYAQDWLRRMSEQQEEEEKEIRELAVAQFDGKNKKPFIGIEIKEFSVIKVLDEKKTLIWASQNAPSILKLDQTKFKKAVENLELDFVEKNVEYRGQIASDLSEYLK